MQAANDNRIDRENRKPAWRVAARTEQLQRLLEDTRCDAIITCSQPRPAVTSYFVELYGTTRVARIEALATIFRRMLDVPALHIVVIDDRHVRIDL